MRHDTSTGRHGERGVALVTALLLTLIIFVLGTGLLVSSRGAQRTEIGFKNQQRTFEVAVAALDRAREVVRQAIFNTSTTTYSSLLAAAAGADGNLVDSTDLDNFNLAAGIPTIDDVPIVGDTTLGGVTYRVYLTNDPWDGPTNKVDGGGDGRHVFTLTAVARGENADGLSAVQGIFRGFLPFPIPVLPGAVTLPGPSIDFSAATSNQATLNGDGGDPPCYPTIATSTNTAEGDAVAAIPSNRRGNYTTCNPTGAGTLNADTGSVENFLNTNNGANPYNNAETNVPILTPPGLGALGGTVTGCNGNERDMISVSCLGNIVARIQATAPSIGGYVGPSPTDAQLGTPANPKIVVITGDFTMGPGSFGGLLVVKGDLTMNGNSSYTGTILAVGNGWVRRNGGGNGVVCGGILVADTVNTGETDDSWIAGGWVAQPHYEHNGGGTSQTGTCAKAIDGTFLDGSMPFARIAFQQLRRVP